MQTKILYWSRGKRDFLYIRSATIRASKVLLGACGRVRAQSRSFHGKHCNTRCFFYKKPSEGPSSKSFLFIVWNTMFLVLNVSYFVS